MADNSSDGAEAKQDADVSRSVSVASAHVSPSKKAVSGHKTTSAVMERGGKDTEAQFANVTVTIAVAYPKASDDHSRLLEELVKKNRRTVDAPRAHQYLHCEYTVAPSHERTLTDVVTYAVAAKIFTETDSRVVKTWDTGDHAWVAWMNSHQVDISTRNLMSLYNHTVDVTVWDSKDKVSVKARTDRPKAFRLPSISEVDFPGRGVQAVVAKQSKSWEMLQPRDSVIDTQQSTVEPEPEPEPEPERRETPVVQKELEEADQQKTAELKTNRHQKRIRSSLVRLAGVDTSEEEQKRLNELQKQQAKMQKQLAKNRRKSKVVERLMQDKKSSEKVDAKAKRKSPTQRSDEQAPDTPDVEHHDEAAAETRVRSPEFKDTGNAAAGAAEDSRGGPKKKAKKGRLTSNRPSKSSSRSKPVTVSIKLEHWFSGTKTLTSRVTDMNGNIRDVLVTISLDKPLLPEEVERSLKPLVVQLKAVKDLPNSPVPYNQLKETCEQVYCKYSFLGHQTHITAKRPHGKHVFFEDKHVILLGKLNEGELREYIQSQYLEVEVHDRDMKEEEKPAEPSIFGEERMDEKISDIGVISGKRTTFNALQSRKKAYDPYGVAKIPLIDLLKGQSNINLRVNVNPCPVPGVVRDPTHFDANTRLVGIPGAVDRPERLPQPTGHYLQSGTVLKVRLTLPYPLVPSANVPRLLPLPSQMCTFSRMAFVFSYKNKEFLKRIENFVTTTNAAALELGHLPSHVIQGALSTYKLTVEQKRSQTLDIVTGFHVIDDNVHVIVLEGLREGAMQRIRDEVLPTDVGEDEILSRFFDTSTSFSTRLYAGLDVDLCRVRLHQAMGEILEQPLLYVRDMVPKPCLEGITRVNQMTKMSRFREIVASNLFPTAEMVISMSREFGVPLTYEDFENHHKPRQETVVDVRSPSPVKLEKRTWTPLDNVNRPYIDLLKQRSENGDDQHNYVIANIVAAQEAGKRRRPLHPSVRSLTTDLLAFNYSTQALNSTELGKDVLRSMLAEKDSNARFAYHAGYNSAMFDPVNVDAFHRKREEEQIRAWRTSEGFVYPGVKSSRLCNEHPLKPEEWRISELRLPFRDNVLHRNILMPTLDRERMKWDDRLKDIELYRRPPSEFGKEPATIHLAGDLRKFEEEDCKRADAAKWKSHVVVDDVNMRFHRLLWATEQSNASNQLDKLTEQLKDPPKKQALRQKAAPVLPPLSVVANPSVDTAARNRGVVLPPAFDEEWEQNVGFVPGPHDKLRWSMDINRIPIRDEKHAHFAKLRGHDMKLLHKEHAYLWKPSPVKPLTEDEMATHYFKIPPPEETEEKDKPVAEEKAEDEAHLERSEYRVKFAPHPSTPRLREIYPRHAFHGFVPLDKNGKPVTRDASIELVGMTTEADISKSDRNVNGGRQDFSSPMPQQASVELVKQPLAVAE